MKYRKPNNVGVYSDRWAEKLVFEHGTTRSEIALLEIAPGKWADAIHVTFANCGMGEPLMDINSQDTRGAALLKAINHLVSYCGKQGDPDAPRVISWANSKKQMRLF
jgi:hypothetical protein